MTTSSLDERDDEGRFGRASHVFPDTMALPRAEPVSGESERRFRAMIDALPAAIYTTDAAGHLTHFNSAAVELAGRQPDAGHRPVVSQLEALLSQWHANAARRMSHGADAERRP